jgi:hypothetical protein
MAGQQAHIEIQSNIQSTLLKGYMIANKMLLEHGDLHDKILPSTLECDKM